MAIAEAFADVMGEFRPTKISLAPDVYAWIQKQARKITVPESLIVNTYLSACQHRGLEIDLEELRALVERLYATRKKMTAQGFAAYVEESAERMRAKAKDQFQTELQALSAQQGAPSG